MKTTKILPSDDAFFAASKAPRKIEYSMSQCGLLMLAFALLLGLTPWFLGVGWQWTLVLSLGASALWQSESGKMTLPSWFAPLFVLLVVAQAFRVLDLAFVPLLWAVAAFLLCRGWWKTSQSAANGLANRMRPRHLWVGHRVWIALGCALSLGSLGLTWGVTSPLWSYGWMGGMQTQMGYETGFNSYSGQYETTYGLTTKYNPMLYANNYLFPGFAFSGRRQPQATWAIVVLLFVLGWAMLKKEDAAFRRGSAWALGALVFAALWWFGLRNDQSGPRWFLVGLAMTAFGVWKLRNGEDSGAHDPKSLLQKVRKLKNKEPAA